MESPPTMCFLCYEATRSSETRLLTNCMPHSNATLLLKIEQLLEGHHMMIVIGEDDQLCERCYNLFIEFNKLEVALKGFLTIKFNLGNFNCVSDDVEPADQLSVEVYSTDVIIYDEPLEKESFDLVSSDANGLSEDIPISQEQDLLTWSRLVPEHSAAESNSVCEQESLDQVDALEQKLLVYVVEELEQESPVYVVEELEQELPEHVGEEFEEESMENVAEALEQLKKSRKHCIKSRRPQRCPKCASVLASTFGLAKHMKLHNSVPVMCELCDTTFPDGWLCRQHVHKVHLQHTLQQGRPAFRNILSKSRTKSTNVYKQVRKQAPTRQFKCTKCECVFKDTSSLENHLRRHKSAPVECNICDAVLPDSLLLRQHKRLVHDSLNNLAAPEQLNGRYPCPVCELSLKTKETLKRHLTCHNTGSVKCRTCDEILPDKTSFLKHTEEVHKVEFPAALLQQQNGLHPCPICARPLKSKKTLQRHLTCHNSGSVKCGACDEILPDKAFLLKHREEVHRLISEDQPADQEQSSTGQSLLASEGALQDTQPATATNSNAQGATVAKKGERKFKCPKCPVVLTRSSLWRHLASHNSGPVTCRVCKSVLPDRLLLQQHTHEMHLQGVQPVPSTDSNGGQTTPSPSFCRYKCPKCSRVLANRSSLKGHLAKHGLQPIKCKLCPETLPDNLTRQQHMLKVHQQTAGARSNQERELAAQMLLESEADVSDQELPSYMKRTAKWPFKCPKCAYLFKRRNDLSRHMDLHKSAPVKCTRCPKMLPDRLLFKHHMQMVHLQDFQCAECRAVLPSKWMLVRHLAAHKPDDPSLQRHLCSVCGKELRTAYGLRSHERRHESDSDLVGCAECPERFLNRLLLRRHEVQAHDKVMKVQPYRRCVQCSQVFRDWYNLKRHKDLVHGPGTTPGVSVACRERQPTT